MQTQVSSLLPLFRLFLGTVGSAGAGTNEGDLALNPLPRLSKAVVL